MTEIASIAAALAKVHEIPVAHVRAVIDVESGGKAFTTVRDRFGATIVFPLMRWEGHYFYRLLSFEKRDRAVREGLANPRAGRIKNPRSQQARFDLFMRACEIDRAAAIESCSWGVGQVMGTHWRKLDLASAEDLYRQAASGLSGQIELIFDYCEAFGLIDELQAGQWSAFARGYNGPGYRSNRYDTKLSAAAKRHGSGAPVSDGMLRMGSNGARVRELQTLLVRAGFGLKVDGDFGPSTKTAVTRLQKAAKIQVDGVVGPETLALLDRFRQSPVEDLTKTKIVELPGIEKAAATVTGAAVVTNVKESIEAAAGQIGALAGYSTLFETAASGLVAIAGVLGVVAAGYAAWEWVKSRKTFEGVSA